jgi:hypothetical protein
MTEKQMIRAIKKLDDAIDALSDIFDAALEAEGKTVEQAQADNGILLLRSDLLSLSQLLEDAKWWRKL